MAINMIPRAFEVCPLCGGKIEYTSQAYCIDCKETFAYDFQYQVFRNPNIVDISYRDPESSLLSNLFPHGFSLGLYHTTNPVHLIHFASMEAFLRGLCWSGSQKVLEEEIAPLYGVNAVNVKHVLPDWKENQTLFWDGSYIKRESSDYAAYVKEAYHALFQTSSLFRMALEKTKGKILIHSIGKKAPRETLLTEKEFIRYLSMLRDRL